MAVLGQAIDFAAYFCLGWCVSSVIVWVIKQAVRA